MKYSVLLGFVVLLGCQDHNQNSYLWIQAYNSHLMEGASNSVAEKGNRVSDVTVLRTMQQIKESMDDLISSADIVGKETTLSRVQMLIDSLKTIPTEAQQFLTLTSGSSSHEFEIQLALLQQAVLRSYADEIAIKDISFDRLELRFIPEIINSERVVGQLVFTASSYELANEAKMFINGDPIKIKDRIGIVNLPRNSLQEGSFDAKIVIERAEYELEQEIQIPKQLLQIK